MEYLLGISLGIFMFICTITAYITGVKHGRQMGGGILPKMQFNPVTAYQEAVEAKESKEKEKEAVTEFTDILGTTKESLLQQIISEKGR